MLRSSLFMTFLPLAIGLEVFYEPLVGPVGANENSLVLSSRGIENGPLLS